MKRLALALSLVLALSTSACTSSNQYGECVGVQDPHEGYKVSAWNVAMGAIFIETLFAPAITLFCDFYCPTAASAGKK